MSRHRSQRRKMILGGVLAAAISGVGYVIGAIGPSSAGHAIVEHIGRPLLKRIHTALEGDSAHVGNHCSAVNSPNAVVHCGPEEPEPNSKKGETQLADAGERPTITSSIAFSERWPELRDALVARPNRAPDMDVPTSAPRPTERRKLPPWHYAYAIDYFVQGEGEGDEATLYTVWIRCDEPPSSKRVAELCAASPEYRRTHHLVRKW